MSSLQETLVADQTNEFDVTAEQQDTANLLERLLGKAVSDRYIDFCRLSSGAFQLRVSSPLAGHALRELDSILRQTLGAPFQAIAAPSEGEEARAVTATNILRELGFNDEEIDRAAKALQPQVSHKDQIRRIVARLGLAEDGDIARAWIAVSAAHKKAHERPFNRMLAVDDQFRTEWSDPFHMVVRGIAVELQGRYTALTARVEELAAMTDKARALLLYEREIPGALPLQWHFFQNISGAAWLPELLKRGLITEPLPLSADETKELPLRQWPVGCYLLQMAKSNDAATRSLVIYVLRQFASCKHPDVRRDGLQILATLPPSEAAHATDLATSWISEDEHFFGVHFGEQIMARLAVAGETDACLEMARALYRVFERSGHLATLFSQHMYEHSMFKMTPSLTTTLGLDALKMFCDLLYQAAVITDKVRTDPPTDYTAFSSLPVPQTESEQYDVYGALTSAVLRCSSQLIEEAKTDGAAVMAVLTSRPYRVYERIALQALAKRPKAAPSIAEALLFDTELLESGSLSQEYAALAVAWFPFMNSAKQEELLAAIDAIPEKYADLWRKRFTEHYKRVPNAEEERDYVETTIRDATWYWKSVLPPDRQEALTNYVAKRGGPDAWRNAFADLAEESPLTPADFAARGVNEIANYLKSWRPDADLAKQTKTALAFELKKAVQENPLKFSRDAKAFVDLPPLYVRQLFEGLQQAVQNKASIDWSAVLDLVELVVARAESPTPGEVSKGGDDPSWFWAAKEAIEMLRSCLQRGEEVISLDHAERLRAIVRLVEQIAPETPELDDFEERYTRNHYCGAQATMFGLAAELNILFVYWLSKHRESPIFAKPREAFDINPDFTEFAERALQHSAQNGRIGRAVFGRYFSWLIHFGEEWVTANFSKIFPKERELWEAAWLGHLLNDNRPARNFVERMHPIYEDEFVRLRDTKPGDDRDYRQDRCGEYVIVLYLWGVLPNDLLESFLRYASDRLRRHVMWFVGRDLKSVDIPADVRARALAYWEMRLAAAIDAPNKDDFREELGVIAFWDSFAPADAEWLIAQQLKMLRNGFTPSNAYSVVDWASRIAPEHSDGTVELIEALFMNPRTDRWAYTANQPAVRTILTVGMASECATTRERVRKIVGYLASMGETGFLDLVKEPEPEPVAGTH